LLKAKSKIPLWLIQKGYLFNWLISFIENSCPSKKERPSQLIDFALFTFDRCTNEERIEKFMHFEKPSANINIECLCDFILKDLYSFF